MTITIPKRLTRALAWIEEHYHRWRRPIKSLSAAWLIGLSLALLVIGSEVSTLTQHEKEAARISCERAQIFGPPLGLFFEEHHALSPALIQQYETLIPKSC